jgi:hypothetical protein
MSKKRIYEFTSEQTTINDADYGQLDKNGYPTSKKFTMLNLWNYIKTKADTFYQTFLVSGTNIKTINGESVLGSGNLEVGGANENIATNDLVFTANSTTDFDGYKATFDNAELKIIADGNTVSDVPFEITQTNGTNSIMKVTGDANITVTSELFNQICPTDTARLKISGTGRTNLDFAVGGTNRGNIYSDGGQINISHNIGFIQYTCRNGLTADGNLDTNRVTFAYDNVTNDFKIKFKKDDGTVITKTIS